MVDDKGIACAVCGTPNPRAATTCSMCGVALREAARADHLDDVLRDLLEAPEEKAPRVADETLDLDVEIVDDLLDSLMIEGQAEPKPTGIRVECPLCGYEVAADATRCDECGTEFVEVELAPEPKPVATSEAPAAPPAPARRAKPGADRIPVSATPTESEARGSILSARLIDVVVGGTSAGLAGTFVGFRLYSWTALTSDPLPIALFLGIAVAGIGLGTILFRLSTSFLARGDRFVKAGRYQEALAYFDRAVRMAHRPSDAWTSKGVALKRLGRLEDALRCQQMAVRLDPENEIAWCNQGDLYFRLGDFPKALECYDKAIQIRPRYAIAWNNRGAALARMDRFEEARDCHDRAVELQPKYVAAWLNRGEVLARLGEREEAQRCLERARVLSA